MYFSYRYRLILSIYCEKINEKLELFCDFIIGEKFIIKDIKTFDLYACESSIPHQGQAILCVPSCYISRESHFLVLLELEPKYCSSLDNFSFIFDSALLLKVWQLSSRLGVSHFVYLIIPHHSPIQSLTEYITSHLLLHVDSKSFSLFVLLPSIIL